MIRGGWRTLSADMTGSSCHSEVTVVFIHRELVERSTGNLSATVIFDHAAVNTDSMNSGALSIVDVCRPAWESDVNIVH